MTLLLNTLGSVINQIAKSVQLATLVPASILVLCNLVFIFPALDIDVKNLEDSVLQMILTVLVIITFSYLLWLLNGPFVKLLEGYTFEETRLGRRMIKNQRDKFDRIEQNLGKCKEHLRYANKWLESILPLRCPRNTSSLQADPEYKGIHSLKEQWLVSQARYLEERFNHFPHTPERILPTRLGNTIAAFEHYPYLRYGIDGPVVWPRLVPILDKNGFAAYVEREKAAFDFLLNLMVVLTLLALECISLCCLFLQLKWLWGVALAIPLVVISYSVLITNAVYWGDMTKVAFDLHRHDLCKALLGRRPNSLKEERELWKNISVFLATSESPPSTTWDYSLLEEKHHPQDKGKSEE
jgi:hypothetical protein